METTENQKRFHECYQLSNQLMEVAGKDALAEVARILAIHVAHYESKYGKVSTDETLKLLHSVTLNNEEVGMAANAMEYLTAVLGVATGLVDDDPVHWNHVLDAYVPSRPICGTLSASPMHSRSPDRNPFVGRL